MITKLNRLWKRLLDKKKIGSFEFRMKINAPERKWYAYILYNSAMLAKKLNFNRISAIEYGVAKGRGLVILEEYAEEYAEGYEEHEEAKENSFYKSNKSNSQCSKFS